MTNGPYLEVSLAAAQGGERGQGTCGDEVVAPNGKCTLNVRVQCANWYDVDRVQVLVSGRFVEELNFTRAKTPGKFSGGVVKFEQSIPLELKADEHIIVATAGINSTMGPVRGPQHSKTMPVAVSNPDLCRRRRRWFQSQRRHARRSATGDERTTVTDFDDDRRMRTESSFELRVSFMRNAQRAWIVATLVGVVLMSVSTTFAAAPDKTTPPVAKPAAPSAKPATHRRAGRNARCRDQVGRRDQARRSREAGGNQTRIGRRCRTRPAARPLDAWRSFRRRPASSRGVDPRLRRGAFSVTTKQPLVQKFIDQGIGQLHGFWYFEAERSFRQAASLDPDCASAYWGMAWPTSITRSEPRASSAKRSSVRTKRARTRNFGSRL